MKNSIAAYLGFAAKAGRLAFGQEKTAAAAATGKAKLILISNDVSPKSRKEMLFTADKFSVKAVILEDFSAEDFRHATGRMGSVIGVCDDSFANAILQKSDL